MTLGEKIQDLRRRRGISQDEMAEKLEVSRQAVSKWERDEAVPETEKIIRIAQVFQVSTDYLLMDSPASAGPAEPSAGQQVLRSLRRNGYKAGYGLLAAGAVICAIALLIAFLLPRFGAGMFHMVDSFGSSPYDTFPDSEFGGLFSEFDQQTNKMETMWTKSTQTIAWIVAGPMLLIGIVMLTGGIVITVKGKKKARTDG